MSTEGETDRLWILASDFTGIPPDLLRQSRRLLVDCLIAESTRIALQEAVSRPQEWPITHILTVRAWVTRKLRGIIPEVRENKNDDVGRVLRGAVGPNLEFLGDVVFLASGSCMPAPTRAVPLGGERFLLISGLPSSCFVKAGLKVQATGIVRWLVDTSEDDLERMQIPIQSRESYVGMDLHAVKPETYLLNCLAESARADLSVLADAEYYIGNVNDSYGFEFGGTSRRIEIADGFVSILRSPREWEQFDYWIRFDSSNSPTVTVSVPRRQWKRAALAFDSLAGRPRMAVLTPRDTDTMLSLNFGPPESEMRWIHAMGGQWLGSQGQNVRWAIPTATSQTLRDLLGGLWLKVQTRTSP